MKKAPLPVGWEALQGVVQLLADPRARDGLPREEVASLLGIPADQVNSWIDRINAAGPIEPEPGSGVYAEFERDVVRIVIGGLPGPIRFSLREVLALLTLIAQLDLAGSPFAKKTRRLTDKLLSAVSAGVEESARPLHERIRIQPDSGTDAELLTVLKEAADARLIVDLEYYNLAKDKSWRRMVKPHLLVQHMGIWYVVVDEVYRLRVDRIRSAKMTEERFDPPPGFDPEKFRGRVMFDGEPDHELFLRGARKSWSIKSASPRMVRSWVMQRLGGVILEAPEGDRGELIAETKEILKKYAI